MRQNAILTTELLQYTYTYYMYGGLERGSYPLKKFWFVNGGDVVVQIACGLV